MKLSSWINLKAWINILAGLVFILLPIQAIGFWGTETDDAGLAAARFFGQMMFMSGLMLYLMRKVHDAVALKAIASAVLVGDVVGFIIALRMTLAGTINAFGWVIAAVYLILALGFGYSLIRLAEPVSNP